MSNANTVTPERFGPETFMTIDREAGYTTKEQIPALDGRKGTSPCDPAADLYPGGFTAAPGNGHPDMPHTTDDRGPAARPEGDTQGDALHPDEKMLDFKEALEFLRIGQSTLRDYVRAGRVQAYRLGGGNGRLLFFRRSDLMKLYEPVTPAQAVSPPDETERKDIHEAT